MHQFIQEAPAFSCLVFIQGMRKGNISYNGDQCPLSAPLHSITALAYPAVTDHLVGIRQCQTDKICRHLITQAADRFLKSGK